MKKQPRRCAVLSALLILFAIPAAGQAQDG